MPRACSLLRAGPCAPWRASLSLPDSRLVSGVCSLAPLVSGPWSQGTANRVQECLLNRHELTEGNGTTQLTFQAVPNTHQWAAQAHFTVAKQPQLATLM